jgi:hypothetical protein
MTLLYDTQHNNENTKLSIIIKNGKQSTHRQYAECRIVFAMLSVVMFSVISLNAVASFGGTEMLSMDHLQCQCITIGGRSFYQLVILSNAK